MFTQFENGLAGADDRRVVRAAVDLWSLLRGAGRVRALPIGVSRARLMLHCALELASVSRVVASWSGACGPAAKDGLVKRARALVADVSTARPPWQAEIGAMVFKASRRELTPSEVRYAFGLVEAGSLPPRLAALRYAQAALEAGTERPASPDVEVDRLWQTGVLRLGGHARFVARLDDLDRFEPSPQMLWSLAEAGMVQALEERLVGAHRAGASRDVLRAIAHWMAYGELPKRLSRTALQTVRRIQVRKRIAQGELGAAESIWRQLVPGRGRDDLAVHLVEAWSTRLVARRDLVASISNASPLTRTRLRLATVLARGDVDAIQEAMSAARRPLKQVSAPRLEDVLAESDPSPWEVFYRAHVALSMARGGAPLSFPYRVRQAVELRGALHDELVATLRLERASVQRAMTERTTGLVRIAAVEAGLPRGLPARLDALGTSAVIEHATRSTAHGFLAGVAGASEDAARAFEAPRAAYDLGRAVAGRVSKRAVSLRKAIRRTLCRSALGPIDCVMTLRLATLGELGGDTTAMLESVVLDAGVPEDARLALLERLAHRALPRAGAAFWQLVRRSFASMAWLERAAALLEQLGALESGLAAAWRQLGQTLRRQGVDDDRWRRQLAAEWQRRFAYPVTATELVQLCRDIEANSVRLDSPHDALDDIAQVAMEASKRGLFAELARAGATPSRGLCWAITWGDRNGKPWSPTTWKSYVAELTQDRITVLPRVADRMCTALRGRTKLLRERLLAGEAPLPTLEAPVALWSPPRAPSADVPNALAGTDEEELLAGLELTWLHKQRDVLDYLRLADSVHCCFNSDTSYFNSGMTTRRWVYRIWKDPLSFVFHLRRKRLRQAIGFVFGGFGFNERDQPLMWLNGIYLAQQKAVVRNAVMGAIERVLARPLGIKTIALGAAHGGHGPLPSAYRCETQVLERVRALGARTGKPEQRIYDDVGHLVNQPIRTTLWYRNL